MPTFAFDIRNGKEKSPGSATITSRSQSQTDRGEKRKSNNTPANMYMWAPYRQNLGIYPIQVLHGPHIGFFCPYKTHICPILV